MSRGFESHALRSSATRHPTTERTCVSDLRPHSRRSLQNPTLARHGRLKRSNSFKTLSKVLAGVLAVVFVSGISVAGIATFSLASAAQPTVHLASEKTAGPIP